MKSKRTFDPMEQVNGLVAMAREIQRTDPAFWESITTDEICPPDMGLRWNVCWAVKQYDLADPDIRELPPHEYHAIRLRRYADALSRMGRGEVEARLAELKRKQSSVVCRRGRGSEIDEILGPPYQEDIDLVVSRLAEIEREGAGA